MSFKITVEVPLFLAFYGFLLTISINTNLVIFRTCYVTLGYDKYNCSLLGNSKTPSNSTRDLEKIVQPTADDIMMVKSLTDTLIGAFFCLFVGAWSDRFGRRPVIIISLIGYALMNLILVIYAAFENASPWLMMTSSIPVYLTGGGASLLSTFLSYLSDITSKEERGFRMGLFEVIMAISVLLGTSSSSYIFNATSYVAIYSIATITTFLALVYTWFFIPESLEDRETTNRVKGIFQTENVLDMFRTTFKNRPKFDRAVILLIMFALALYFVTIYGDISVMFLFMRRKFNWNLRQYTLYSSATNCLWIVGTLFIVYVINYKLHVKESIIVFVGFLSLTFGAFIQGIAKVDWFMYVASVVKIGSSGISPMTRSLLSKSVNPDEVGKIFAVLTLTQNLLGLVGTPVYTTLYNATLDKEPGIFNYLTCFLMAVNVVCLLAVLIFQRRTTYEVLNNIETSGGSSNSEQNLVINQ